MENNMPFLQRSMSWDQLNEAVKRYGYLFSPKTRIIYKNGKLVSKLIDKQQAINYVIDRRMM